VSKTIAIMQPTFLPWIGYFAMIDRVDEFVFLDSVQYARRSWQQRNKVKTPDGPKWVTVSIISKGLRDQKISEARVDHETGSLEKIERTICANYARAPFFKPYSAEFIDILRSKPEKLADLNTTLIRWAMGVLGIRTPLASSEALAVEGAKADLLASICRERKADRYLSAPASREYLEESSALSDAGVALEYHEYEHPSYPQPFGEFAPYMCVADLIFNAGPEGLPILRSGVAEVRGGKFS